MCGCRQRVEMSCAANLISNFLIVMRNLWLSLMSSCVWNFEQVQMCKFEKVTLVYFRQFWETGCSFAIEAWKKPCYCIPGWHVSLPEAPRNIMLEPSSDACCSCFCWAVSCDCQYEMDSRCVHVFQAVFKGTTLQKYEAVHLTYFGREMLVNIWSW